MNVLLRVGFLSLLIGLTVFPSVAQQPKSAILFIGDGMGVAQVTAGRIYKGNARDGELTLDTLDHIAVIRTHAADRMVTDSAASATALASGVKTNVLRVGMDPEGNAVETVLEMAKKAGKSVGVVSTTTITHATPACFYGHVKSRGREDLLAAQLIDYGEVDVVMGGGRQVFHPKGTADPESGSDGRRRDDRDLFAEAKAAGYRVVFRKDEFDALGQDADAGKVDSKVLALFSPGMMSYEASRPNDAGGQPSLSEMTAVAVKILQRNPKGFFLMVEGGRIDHASHSNNAFRTVTEMVEFDNAVRVGIELTQATNDTLIVITADHETGGLAINGYPKIEVGGMDLFTESPGGKLGDIITYATGPGANRDDSEEADQSDPGYQQLSAFAASSASHTGVDVLAWATGPGAEAVKGTMENDALGRLVMEALGLR